MNRKRTAWTIAVTGVALVICVLLQRCTNDPWPSGQSHDNTFFTSLGGEIKTLDPAVSYYAHEGEILDCIVEMPFCYDYLARPYELVPMLMESIPSPVYYGKDGAVLQGDPPAELVSRVEYLLTLKKGIHYQPHPCFAMDAYVHSTAKELSAYSSPADFPSQGTREMRADDFKIALTRLCDTRLASPVYSSFMSFIKGMEACSDAIKAEVSELERVQQQNGLNPERYSVVPDYRTIPLEGIEVLDDYHFKLVLSRKYPQALYWMALHFFSPVPMEALKFYAMPSVVDAGFSFKNWPVGTGAYQMTQCDLRDHLLLEANPHFRDERYPSRGSADDWSAGLLADAGRRLPFIQKIRFQEEHEYIPVWIKFMQGYYDSSGVPTDMYDAAVNMEVNGDMTLSPQMEAMGIKMVHSVGATSFYMGFNMLDPLVGGMEPQKKKLRQALSMALDFQEFIDVFLNGRGVMGSCIIPPGIYGALEGEEHVNPFIDKWDDAKQRPVRQPLERAKQLMAEAGYPNGIGSDGRQLVLHYDASGSGSQSKDMFLWMRDKLSRLGVDLEERLTDLNRYRDKMNKGDWQIMFTGWLADYPDPENFLFLFYSENGVVASGGRGSNKVNYSSAEYDNIFKQLETMENGPERLELIRKATRILQEDAPCCWGYHPKSLSLTHGWLKNYKPHHMGKTFYKCLRIDAEERQQFQASRNQPVLWPAYALTACGWGAVMVCLWRRKRERRCPPGRLD